MFIKNAILKRKQILKGIEENQLIEVVADQLHIAARFCRARQLIDESAFVDAAAAIILMIALRRFTTPSWTQIDARPNCLQFGASRRCGSGIPANGRRMLDERPFAGESAQTVVALELASAFPAFVEGQQAGVLEFPAATNVAWTRRAHDVAGAAGLGTADAKGGRCGRGQGADDVLWNGKWLRK